MKFIYVFLVLLVLCNSIALSKSKYRIIVFDFNVAGTLLTKDDGELVADAIRISLNKYSNNPDVEILEREEIAKLFKDVSAQQALPSVYNDSTAIKLGKLLQGNYVLLGRVAQSSLLKGFRITARLVDVESGSIISSDAQNYEDVARFDDIVNQISENILIKLDIPHNRILSRHEKKISNLKALLTAYKPETLFPDKKNRITYSVFLVDETSYLSYRSSIQTMGDINPETRVLGGVITSGGAWTYSNNYNHILLALNEDGLYWRIYTQSSNWNNPNEISSGITWNDLAVATLLSQNFVVQEKISSTESTIFGEYENVKQEEIRDEGIFINGKLLIKRSHFQTHDFDYDTFLIFLTQARKIVSEY